MKYIIQVGCIILFLVCLYLYIQYINKKQIEREIKIEKEKYIANHRKELEAQAHSQLDNLRRQKEDLNKDIQQRTGQLASLTTQLTCLNRDIDTQRKRALVYEKELRANAEEMAKTYEQDLLKVADARVAAKKEGMLKAAMTEHEETMTKLNTQASEAKQQIQELQNEIKIYTAKQTAINEAILRQRALEEQQDFYRVCLTPETVSDVFILNEARQNLKKPEIIDKIIYDNYIAKPVLEMIKRVLQNTTCSGIYKITCQKTGEIYIGKSTDVKTRWQQHCKSAFNCGTIAHSLLHTKMRQYGLECFTFELLEKVPKDQLTEREKFYIDFYKTKEIGLNERSG